MVTALSSATMGSGCCAPGASAAGQLTGREGLLDELDAEAHQLRQQRARFLGQPAGVGIDPQGPP